MENASGVFRFLQISTMKCRYEPNFLCVVVAETIIVIEEEHTLSITEKRKSHGSEEEEEIVQRVYSCW